MAFSPVLQNTGENAFTCPYAHLSRCRRLVFVILPVYFMPFLRAIYALYIEIINLYFKNNNVKIYYAFFNNLPKLNYTENKSAPAMQTKIIAVARFIYN